MDTEPNYSKDSLGRLSGAASTAERVDEGR